MFKQLSRIISIPFRASQGKTTERTLYYSMESARAEMSEAEKQLKAEGYPPIGGFIGGGGGFMVRRGSIIIDSNGYGEGSETRANNRMTNAGHGYGGASLGYIIKETRLLRFYPLVGIGGGGGGVIGMMEDRSQKPHVETGGGGMLLWLGFGVDLCLPIWKLRLMFGMRTGLHIPLIGDKTQVYKGPFMRWNIGVGWQSSD